MSKHSQEKTNNPGEFKKEILRPAVILTVICLTVSVCLALTNFLTEDTIAKRAKEDEENAMRALIAAETYEKADVNGEVTFTVAKNGGETVGYIVKSAANGYGGEVSVMTAIGTDAKIVGVNILDVTNETPGLGQNAAKESFFSQLIGLKNKVTVVKNGAKPENNEYNAVTGATITSRAVEKAVNKALEAYKTYTEKATNDNAAQPENKESEVR